MKEIRSEREKATLKVVLSETLGDWYATLLTWQVLGNSPQLGGANCKQQLE